MKTATTRRDSTGKATSSNIRMLETMIRMLDENMKGASPSEQRRLQGELAGVRAALKALGA